VIAKKATESKSKKGGNRGGHRPKGSLNKVTLEIRTACAAHGPAMVANLVDLAHNADSEAARVAASKEILDRGYGKSSQPVEHSGVVTKYVEVHRDLNSAIWEDEVNQP
jgi:hypothetical protein